MSRRAWVCAIGVGFTTLVAAWVGCGSDETRGAAGAAGAAGSGGAGGAGYDAGDASVWDPDWHETALEPWPEASPASPPSCGPGCKPLFSVPTWHRVDLGPGFSPTHFVSELEQAPVAGGSGEGGLGLRRKGEPATYRIGPGAQVAEVDAWGAFASYVLVNEPATSNQIEVMNLDTGERKVVHWYSTDPKPVSALQTALNAQWVLWEFSDPAGLYGRNLETGEIATIAQGPWSCVRLSATATHLVCPSIDKGRIFTFDLAAPAPVKLDDGGALQTEAYLSIDRTRLAWIDYRDPPGQSSTYDFGRNGGEVYVHDFATGKTTRRTFDSPSSPRGKVAPAAGLDRVVWSEAPATAEQNPSSANALYGVSTTLAVLNLETGARCRANFEYHIGPKAVDGHHVYAAGLDWATQKQWVFDIDLDDAGHEWECGYAPAAPQ